MSTSEVLIIGAGPYGLSIATHLSGLGIDHRIVGRPLDTWRTHMPAGMYLKSEPYGSDMSCPQAGYDVAAYCRAQGIDPIGRGTPLSVERFLDYGDWYVKQLVPDVSDHTVTEIKAVNGGFQVAFAEAEALTVKQVVVATGVLPHAYTPAELSGLPSELVSHTADHHGFEAFSGRSVAVVGAGQSALETAALLHEAGADTHVVARCPELLWHPKPLPLTKLRELRLPITKLCEGWKCVLWNTPTAFRRLPRSVQIDKARTVLGPRGAWWLRDRIEGKVEVLTGQQVRAAESSGSGVRLLLSGQNQAALEVDHVIAGTGFHIDTANLGFLAEGLRARIAARIGYPVLSRAGESTVPGLYFAGAPASVSLGPSMRFIAGTHNATSQIAQSVARRAKAGGSRPVAPAASDELVQETA